MLIWIIVWVTFMLAFSRPLEIKLIFISVYYFKWPSQRCHKYNDIFTNITYFLHFIQNNLTHLVGIGVGWG